MSLLDPSLYYGYTECSDHYYSPSETRFELFDSTYLNAVVVLEEVVLVEGLYLAKASMSPLEAE